MNKLEEVKCSNRMLLRLFFASLILLFAASWSAKAEESQKKIYQIDIREEIGPKTQLYLSNGLKEAAAYGADNVIINMNTYGGLVDAADSMRTAILYNKIPVSVFIDNNAASAGALISIACDKIYMRRGASIGAATVVNGGSGEAMPDKYQSFMRSMMRATAEAHGKDTIIKGADTTYIWKRDPAIAEAMVDQRIYIPNLIDTGKVLTLTAEEAVKWHYCDGIEETIPDVIKNRMGYDNYEIKAYQPSLLDKIKGFFMHPALQAVLIMIIVGGIYFELQSPGIGFPSIAAIIAAILYFVPLYIDGIATYWEIIVFILGIILLIVEIFIIPGFGVAGVMGIVFMIIGLLLSLVNNVDFNFDGVSTGDFSEALLIVAVGLICAFVLIIWIMNKVGSKGLFSKMALHADLKESVTQERGLDLMIGEIATAMTPMRPAGKIRVNNEVFDSVSISGFIEKGEDVKITSYQNGQLYVERIDYR
ncbi:MAG: NfeD family protein [Tannerellaceae bacterium]